MKLSVAWIFNHINADFTRHDIPQLVKKFNMTTAEVEHVEKVSYDVDRFTLGQVVALGDGTVQVQSRELNQTFELPARDNCALDTFYMLTKEQGAWRWARHADWHSSKDGLLPAFSWRSSESAGAWKKVFLREDYILHVDNKSITNRPDLWCHRGFAREMAAILGLPLRDEQALYANHAVAQYDKRTHQASGNSFSVEVEDFDYCKRFASVAIPNVGHYSSWILMAQKLCAVDIRPFDAFVDATNFVMMDIGQPLHVFDAEKINSHTIGVRFARQAETLRLLDGAVVELTQDDCVVTNGKQPIALAGIMGGQPTAVTARTRSLLVEAANFDAAMIRKTAQRLKLRTDASSRFEKTIDPQLNVSGLLRFLKILEEHDVPLATAGDIVSLGKEYRAHTIDIMHSKIEQLLGVALPESFIVKTLEALEFNVQAVDTQDGKKYQIAVPTLRAAKDIRIQEDIVEEIGRFYGFGALPQELPVLELKPHSLRDVTRVRAIRQYMAGAFRAREIYNYALYDEAFLQQLGITPEHAVALANPVSQNWRFLVTSLVPQLIRAVVHAGTHHEEIRFFEWARTWERTGQAVAERKALAGILYNKREAIDFYWAKDQLQALFNVLGIAVSWHAPEHVPAWYHPYKTATLMCDGKVLGYAGNAAPALLASVLEGHAFIFELSGDLLLSAAAQTKKFQHLSKYQDSFFDISMFCPFEVSVEQVLAAAKAVSPKIVSGELVDFFEKKEWGDKRSLTVRLVVQDKEKTLVKEEIDAVHDHVVHVLKKLGVEIR